MSRLLNFLISAPGIATVFLTAALWSALRPNSRACRRFLLIGAISYLLASIYAIPYALSRPLLVHGLRPVPASDLPSTGRTAIVILGGGGSTVRAGRAHVGIMNADTAARMLEGFRLYTLLHAEWIISSGGTSDTEKPAETSSVMMRGALVRLGVPPLRILLESESQDTHDEAIRVGPMLKTLGADHVVLVTSDIHMQRAMGAFRAQGLRPIPAIAPDGRFPTTVREWIVPTNHGLDYSEAVLHELVGIAYYAARGWITF